MVAAGVSGERHHVVSLPRCHGRVYDALGLRESGSRPVDEVLGRVARYLRVLFLPDTAVRKRQSVGARTDRETWVRIERRLLGEITDQGWNGAECAARLDGVAQPAWRGASSGATRTNR
ncbi:hypothetical protein GCM10010300_44670 [Streptomyces olivaceoviridis]|nr:hypothetical protein GCM10010300_44670 [Streptomyces olivaceoviridis]